MNQTAETPGKKTGKKVQSKGVRSIGYVVSIVVLIVIIYILRHLREWGVTFLNEDFENVLFYLELSIYVSIAANVLFIFYDNRWFKNLLQGIASIFSALAIIMIYVIFPFIIEDDTWVRWIKIALLILFGLTVLSTIIQLIKGIRDLVQNPEKA